MFKTSLAVLFVLIIHHLHSQSLEFNPSSSYFPGVYVNELDSQIIELKPTGFAENTVLHLFTPNSEFSLSADSLVISNNQETKFTIYFKPSQNVVYHGDVFIIEKSKSWMQVLDVVGNGSLGSLYTNTFDKYDEALKVALKNAIKNHQDLGYNLARDRMFMDIDNHKVNGKGASTNALNCSYTGRELSGYNNRAAAQNGSFNTEHTWPQSKFCGSESSTQKSDLHHLFITDNTANSRRSNYPFGNVTGNATWSVGGSKLGNSFFEVRDEQKGITARAMMYFVVRYENCSGFINNQEATLRVWNSDYKPSNTDSIRNLLVLQYQKNRNPFVDFPAFAERISSFSKSENRQWEAAYFAPLKRTWVNERKDDSLFFTWTIMNNSRKAFSINEVQNSQFDWIYLAEKEVEVLPGESKILHFALPYKFDLASSELKILFNENLPSISLALDFSPSLQIQNTSYNADIEVFPNPVQNVLFVKGNWNTNQTNTYSIHDLQGRKLTNGFVSAHTGIDIKALPSGMYLIKIENNNYYYIERFVKQ